MNFPDHLRCCLITDRAQAPGPLIEVVRSALDGGVRFVQVREKDLPTRALHSLVIEVMEAARGFQASVVVNDRIDVALAAGAHGVHLGWQSLDPGIARRILGDRALVGVSVHSLDEARAAQAAGADYLTFGPVYDTPSKAGGLEARGPEAIESILREVSAPVLALGGIRPERVEEVARAGAAGVAVVSFIMRSDDPRRDAGSLRAAVERHIGRKLADHEP